MKRLIVLVVLGWLAISPAAAQTTGLSTIVGTITDSTGAVIPGAKVIVRNTQTAFQFEAVSNQEGYYYVPYLRPGTYNLTVEAQGFKKQVQNGIELRTNEEPKIDIKLDVGSLAESVEVRAVTPLLETETTIAGGVIEGETVVKIPILQKLTFRILPYLPDTQVINGLHLNGGRERAMAYQLDGLSAKEPVSGNVGTTNRVVTASIDAISEVKAYATGMPAEFGHSAGGIGFHLGNGIDAGSDDAVGSADVAADRLLGAETVELIGHGALAPAVEMEAVDDLGVRQVGQDAEGELLQDGDLDYGLSFDDAAGDGGFGFEQRRHRADFHRLGEAADVELDIDLGLLIGAQLDAVLDLLLEALRFDSEVVGAGPEVGDVVVAFLIAHGFKLKSGLRIADDYLGAGNYGTSTVRDGADDGGQTRGLRRGRRNGKPTEDNENDQPLHASTPSVVDTAVPAQRTA